MFTQHFKSKKSYAEPRQRHRRLAKGYRGGAKWKERIRVRYDDFETMYSLTPLQSLMTFLHGQYYCCSIYHILTHVSVLNKK